MTPAFDSGVVSYSATTSNATNTVTAVPEDESAEVIILNGDAEVANGSAATWVIGENTLTITVKNGMQEKVYTVTVTKD